MQLNVHKSGLWVDSDYGFLGASPDGKIKTTTNNLYTLCIISTGLTSDDAIVEVKCLKLQSINVPIADMGGVIDLKKKQKKAVCLAKKDGIIKLKRNHDYYYQVLIQIILIK